MNKESEKQSICNVHKQLLILFCEKCQSFLCPECVDSHKGHPLASLKGIKTTIEQDLSQLLSSMESSIGSWENRETSLKKFGEKYKEGIQSIIETTKTTLKKHWTATEESANEKLEAEAGNLHDNFEATLKEVQKGKGDIQQLVESLKGITGDVNSNDCETLKKCITKIKESKQKASSIITHGQQKLFATIDNLIQNSEKDFKSKSVKLVGRFELVLRAIGKEEPTAESAERARNECKEILEGWKGILDSSIDQISGKLDEVTEKLKSPKDFQDALQQVKEITELVKDIKKIYSIKVDTEPKPKVLEVPEKVASTLRERIEDYIEGKYTCNCSSGEKGGQLSCGHWICLKCAARYSIIQRKGLDPLKILPCPCCGKNIKFRSVLR
eukprot:TRINITY_DN70780_c1_g1_i1.p1 TRINITY_DN70780_c1_g1~~TRINITY_DN70780_c1_g1_i1.p1  ORF type:complete len:411 (+),score=56.37 TRINITY_DN70780_c1_g1_i1:81-1235(+)